MTRPEYAVFLGLDVGKEEHHACGLDPDGERVHDKALPQDEVKLRALFERLSKRGRVLVVVDQPATIGALPVTVARDEGVDVAYLPGWPCAASPTCTRATPRPTPATLT